MSAGLWVMRKLDRFLLGVTATKNYHRGSPGPQSIHSFHEDTSTSIQQLMEDLLIHGWNI